MMIECKETLNMSEKNAVWEILCECDKEFVPPLSSRESSYQSELTGARLSHDAVPVSYFNEIVGQCFLLCKSGDEIAGFMSFKRDYYCPELKDASPSNYITTICVSKEYRNQGITRKFYQYLESNHPDENCMFLTTRTWNTNVAHIKILQSLGFHISETLINHRGEGIDTLYFAKQICN